MTQSNTKGNSFEREMCKRFSLWYSDGKLDDLFWRTSGSGSRATNRDRLGKDLTKYQHGDMTFVRPEGRPLLDFFSFEFKSYSGIDFHGIFHTVSPERSLLSFWAKCVRDAEQSGRVPWLVTKVNKGKTIAWVPWSLLSFFESSGMRVLCDRGCQFWVPAEWVVTKRTYKRLKKKKGVKAKKAKAGKGKPKIEKYLLPEPQQVIGIDLELMLKCLRYPGKLVEMLEYVSLSGLPVPRRKDPTDAAA
jgi:hypothetical protein